MASTARSSRSKRAHEIAGGKGAININVLWEMGGAQRVLKACWNAPRAWWPA
jgi:hypothetical protein